MVEMKEVKVVAVMVAYNRSVLLREALEAVGAQTKPVDKVIIVDNASDDGSTQVAAEMVARFDGAARLIALKVNTGGAGGFAAGIAAALQEQDVDWIWVMDDDTIPQPEALEEALKAHAIYARNGLDNLAVMGSRVIWEDGDDHPMNTPKQKLRASKDEILRADAQGAMAIRSISFVSAFLRAELIRERGLPLASYFLWNDDFEYTTRLLKNARGLYVPSSVVMHKTKIKGSSDIDPGERFYFEVRNKLWVFLSSKSLKNWEKLAYFGASVRRWSRTFRASQSRRTLFLCLVRGLKDGLFQSPQTNYEIMRNAGLPADVLAKIEQFDENLKRSTV